HLLLRPRRRREVRRELSPRARAAMPTLNTAYEDLLRHVLANGTEKSDRTGTGTLSVFGHQMRFDLQQGFPLITTKKVFLRGIVDERSEERRVGNWILFFCNRDSLYTSIICTVLRVHTP